ncbi:MAG: EsaB/YukD family protein, partial [Candidatus Poseidoniia archaeon]|nr:EsaB/YukD family protein [Candidatus Poseidoniia archaeon]
GAAAAPEEDDAAPEAVEAPPVKIALAIQSTVDGKTANVKVPSNMPVERLVQNCVEKFPLPHANFAVHVNGEAVDSGLSLADAGLVDGSEIQLVSLEE